MNSRGKKGITLIEVLLAIIVGIIVLGLAYVIYAKVSSKSNISKAASNASVVIANINNLYSTTQNYKKLKNSIVIQSGLLPHNMTTQNNTIYHKLDPSGNKRGTITIKPANHNAAFKMIYNNIPSQKCIRFSQTMYKKVSQILVNGHTVSKIVNRYKSLMPQKLIKHCNEQNMDTVTLLAY